MTILTVDDHNSFLDCFKLLLTDNLPTATILKASNGLEAIEMVEQEEPDLVILDIKMPYMNGVLLAEHIHKKKPHIKIIILTMHTGEAVVVKLSKIVHGFLFKNADKEEIELCINMVLSGDTYFTKRSTGMVYKNLVDISNMASVSLNELETEVVQLITAGLTIESRLLPPLTLECASVIVILSITQPCRLCHPTHVRPPLIDPRDPAHSVPRSTSYKSHSSAP